MRFGCHPDTFAPTTSDGPDCADAGRLRRSTMILLVLLAFAAPVHAHPGVGIVMDGSGNVYYTDLKHVWRIAPDGSRSLAMRDVHTHELAIDSVGNLYGEDNRHLGDNRYRHRIWRRGPGGLTDDVVPWQNGFWRQYGFVKDSRGAMYWVQCPEERCVITKRSADGRVTTLAPSVRFTSRIQWIAAGADNSIYVVDGRTLRRIDEDGAGSVVAKSLGRSPMGLWPDERGDVFVAIHGDRAVVRVEPNGAVTTVARSPKPWSPAGVLVAPDGALWILEWSESNEARVRRVMMSR